MPSLECRISNNELFSTSVGFVADSYDNAMTEAFNSPYKWELIYPPGPGACFDDVELASVGNIDRFNYRRLHGEITHDSSYVTPAEFEAARYRQAPPAVKAVAQ